jgi:hypothetical protein
MLRKEAQIFWLSYFKCRLTVTADEFFLAVREICEAAQMNQVYQDQCFLFE